jgi:uncharacterized membrane protein (DUF4010 family)
LTNPFRLTEVLRFGAILAVVTILAGIGLHYLGGAGLVSIAALSGLAHVDAIAISTTRLAGRSTPPLLVLTIIVAAASNTVAKTIYAWVAGGNRIGRSVAAGAALAIMCGLAGYVLSPAAS